MQIIIDVPEEVYVYVKQTIISDEIFDELVDAFRKGVPLPKGHRRLIILSENRLKENQIDLDFSFQKWISEVGILNATVTIIEADKESEELT